MPTQCTHLCVSLSSHPCLPQCLAGDHLFLQGCLVALISSYSHQLVLLPQQHPFFALTSSSYLFPLLFQLRSSWLNVTTASRYPLRSPAEDLAHSKYLLTRLSIQPHLCFCPLLGSNPGTPSQPASLDGSPSPPCPFSLV